MMLKKFEYRFDMSSEGTDVHKEEDVSDGINNRSSKPSVGIEWLRMTKLEDSQKTRVKK